MSLATQSGHEDRTIKYRPFDEYPVGQDITEHLPLKIILEPGTQKAVKRREILTASHYYLGSVTRPSGQLIS